MKSNIDYLRELIADNDEAIEFLDAIQEELNDKDKEIEELNDEAKSHSDDIDSKDTEISELEGKLQEQEGAIIPTHEFQGIERIYVQANNLSDAQKIEDVLGHVFKAV